MLHLNWLIESLQWPYEKGISRIPIFQRRKWTSFHGKGLHKVLPALWTTRLQSISLKASLKANHMSSGEWPVTTPPIAVPASVDWGLHSTYIYRDSVSVRIQRRTHSSWWIRLPPLFKMTKLIYPQNRCRSEETTSKCGRNRWPVQGQSGEGYCPPAAWQSGMAMGTLWLITNQPANQRAGPTQLCCSGCAPTNKFLTPVGCPTIQLTSDTIYLKTVSDPRG